MIGQEFAEYLEDQGYGTKGSDLFLGVQPEEPDDCITIFDESVPVNDDMQSVSIDEFGIQIIIRDTTYSGARDTLREIHKQIVGFGGEPLVAGGSGVTVVYVVTPPTSIGQDHVMRYEWTAHYRFRVESSGDTYRG